jgi:hypothetical protein
MTSTAVAGAMQAEAESECKIPVSEALVPVNSPESAGSLLAAGAEEEICQFPVTSTALALGLVVARVSQPVRRTEALRRRLAQTIVQDKRFGLNMK